jgi:hypothetical protein
VWRREGSSGERGRWRGEGISFVLRWLYEDDPWCTIDMEQGDRGEVCSHAIGHINDGVMDVEEWWVPCS